MTIYKNNDSDRWMRITIDNFLRSPNKNFPKDTYWMQKLGKLPKPEPKNRKKDPSIIEQNKADRLEHQRLDKEEALRESMKAEECELISEYIKGDKPVYYLFNGLEYKTTPTKWNTGHRAHKCKCIRYTQNYIKQLFEKEGCTLMSEYKNQKSLLKYMYNDKEYEVIFNNWLYFNKRPHLHDI